MEDHTHNKTYKRTKLNPQRAREQNLKQVARVYFVIRNARATWLYLRFSLVEVKHEALYIMPKEFGPSLTRLIRIHPICIQWMYLICSVVIVYWVYWLLSLLSLLVCYVENICTQKRSFLLSCTFIKSQTRILKNCSWRHKLLCDLYTMLQSRNSKLLEKAWTDLSS